MSFEFTKKSSGFWVLEWNVALEYNINSLPGKQQNEPGKAVKKMKKLPVISILLLLVPLVLTTVNCGYKLSGFTNQIPDYIHSIAIPDFENKTTRFQADQYLTFAVKEEFIKRSKLVLVERTSQADSVLEGTISRFTVTPISYDDNASANLYRINIVVSVRFIDLRTNDIIFEGENISFVDSYDIDAEGEISDDFFSQETDTLIKIAEEFASSIVTTILENF
jgi:outer membrane lipopolysaccharide assembly protein LptE/RlpB